MEKIFLPIYLFFKKQKAACYISMILCFLITGFFAAKIKLVEDIAAVLPKDEKTEKLNTVFNNSKFLDKLVIHVSVGDKKSLNRIAW